MVALKVITTRTGLTEAEAAPYLAMAEDRVRLYLGYAATEDISFAGSAVAEIAIALVEAGKANAAAAKAYGQTGGMTSRSYTEGPVSVKETYADSAASYSAAITAAYDVQIEKSLQTLARFRRVRVVKC